MLVLYLLLAIGTLTLPVASPSVHLSPSRNSSYNFKDGQENEAEETTEPSEKKSKEAGLDTGYDRFTERNC